MPEVIERRLMCDRPGHEDRDARRYHLGDDRRRMVVLLCEECAAPVEEAMSLGTPAPESRPRGSRGLSEQRLRGLPVLPDD